MRATGGPGRPDDAAVVDWLLAQDRHLQPMRIVIERHRELATHEEPFCGPPERIWSFGSHEHGEYGLARFASVAGTSQVQADYFWTPFCGACCLLERPSTGATLHATLITVI